MAPQRKKTSTAAKKPAAPLVRTFADPAPFFSLGAAAFADAIVVTKVISVVLPLRHLRDRTILHEMVLKKLLHRPFEPSAEDLAQQAETGPTPSSTAAAAATANASTSASASPSTSADVYVIVHIKAVEVHADTARQVNPQGDVQVNVMTTLVAARVRHGLIAGVAEVSAFATCMQVRLPSVPVSAAVAATDSHASTTAGLTLEAEGDATAETAPESTSDAVAVAQQLRVTARCLEDEPVAPGQAVLLVSEPAAMRCLAIRPPREAPGPFFFSEDTATEAAAAAAATRKRRTPRKSGAEGEEGEPPLRGNCRRVVTVACEIPEYTPAADEGMKRPRW